MSPALNLSSYTGFKVDGRLTPLTGYTGPYACDLGILAGGVEYYAPAVTLTGSYQNFTVSFASIAPGVNLSSAQFQFRILRNGVATGVGRFDFDQVTGVVPEPAALALLGALLMLRRR